VNNKPVKKYRRFGRDLRLARNNCKMTQACFCEDVGIDTRTLYRWEHGISYPMPIYRNSILKIFPDLGKI